MNFRALIFVVAVYAWGVASPVLALSEKIERAFPVGTKCEVRLDTYRGNVNIEQGETAEVRVILEINIQAKTEEIAQQLRGNLRIEMAAEGDTVTVTGKNPRESAVRFVWEEDNEVDLSYRVIVPKGAKLNLKAINGSMIVGNLKGDVVARLENGAISMRQIEGTIDARTHTGDIVISRCLGDVVARVLRGTIRTGTIGGKADLKNTSGDVEIMSARGEVAAFAEAGDIIVGFPNKVGGPARLQTAGGNIRVQVDPAATCQLEARTRWGRVHLEISLALTKGKSGARDVAATMNGGGPRIAVFADGGQVIIERGETVFQ